MALKRRLVIISYRLPFKLIQVGRKFRLLQNSGGLVSAILSFSEKLKSLSSPSQISRIAWIGFSEHTKRELRRAQQGDELFELFPVALDAGLNKKFYEGFCNNLLWPLLHYFQSFAVFDNSYFRAYVKANKVFCDAIIHMLRPGDIVWVHDYHFMLLPQLIRERNKSVPLGYFLHVPFPSFEIFRLLPHRWREPLVKGMLGADLVGFHTLDYAYHFLKTVKKVLGLEHANRILSYDNRKIKSDAFPISIDYEKFRKATVSPEVEQEILKLKEILREQKLIFSVDRLDYTKGILDRLLGYELFLKEHPEWHEKVLFNMVLIPSRNEIPQYKEMRNQIDALVGRINSEYSGMEWRSIVYQYKSLGFEEMVALYDMSHVGLITPIRDGMNLVAKEYVASQRHTIGVLVLSEMAGAAAELQEAIMINPTDKKEIADAILQALEMPEWERKERMHRMQERLSHYNVLDWTTDFLQQLSEMKKLNLTNYSTPVTATVIRSILQDFSRATKRILFLDYDGTLVPFQPTPDLAIPGKELIDLLQQFCNNEKNIVVLISGRNKEFLERWFGKLRLTLVAEHGAFTKMPFSDWIRITSEKAIWKNDITDILNSVVEKFPGSAIEMKEQSVAWHYRNAPEVTVEIIQQLKNAFNPWLQINGLQMLEGNKVVEIKNESFNKGTAVQQFLSLMKDAFMLAVGDDKTDEDLFRSTPPQAYTIKVGEPSANARYFLQNEKEVIILLKRLLAEDDKIAPQEPHHSNGDHLGR